MITRAIHYFKQFDYPVTAQSLGLFRILYSLYLLGLIFQLYQSWPLYFDNIPGISISYFPAKLCLFLWSIANVLLCFGLFTRYAAVANYLFTVLMAAYFTNINIGSFNDDLLRMGGFLLIVLPSNKCFAIDTFVKKLTTLNHSKKTSYLYYLFAILVSIGFLYFGSGFTKLFSPLWQKGIGLWVPAVLPSYKWNGFHFFVDYKWLMYFLNYLVIAFELFFVVFLFHKKSHPYLAFIGIAFHIVITFLFPFVYLSLGPIVFYSLFLPASFWDWLLGKFQSKNKITIQFNPLKTKHQQGIELLKAIDLNNQFLFIENSQIHQFEHEKNIGFNRFIQALRNKILLRPLIPILRSISIKNLVYYISENWLPQQLKTQTVQVTALHFKRFAFFTFIAALCFAQTLTLTYHTYTAIKADKQKLAMYLKKRISIQDFSTKPSNLARTFFGINSRGVFLDHAFTGTKTVFALAYLNTDSTEKWLPVFNKEGFCESDNIGLPWHKLTFKYFGKSQTEPNRKGLEKYTWLWASNNHISPTNISIRVYRRIYNCPTEYEYGYLTKQIEMPWDTVGIIHWKDSVFIYQQLDKKATFSQ